MLPSGKPSLASRIRRILRRGFIVLAALVIGAGMAENYRGHYMWRNFREKWEAKGEQFDLAGFIPKPVPPDQNFAQTPFFAPYLDYTTDENTTSYCKSSEPRPDGSGLELNLNPASPVSRVSIQ